MSISTASFTLLLGCLSITTSANEPSQNHTPLPLSEAVFQLVENTQTQILNRKFEHAIEDAQQFQTSYPELPLGHLAMMLTYQAWMLEKLGPDFDGVYLECYQRADDLIKQLDFERYPKKDRAILLAFSGGVYGIHGMHFFRQRNWVKALRFGWQGMRKMEEAALVDPTFIDVQLGLGLYEFWRAQIQSDFGVGWLFSDTRTSGLKKIERAIAEGRYAKRAGLFALGLIYIETGEIQQLKTITAGIKKDYPQNILSDFMNASAALRQKNKAEAIAYIKAALKTAPAHQKALFLSYVLDLENANPKTAAIFFNQLLSTSTYPFYQAYAHYSLGYFSEKESQVRARDHYLKALSFEPTLQVARQALKKLDTGER